MKKIILIKASTSNDVRLSKYIYILRNNNFDISFLGWNRQYDKATSKQISKDIKETYLLNGWSKNPITLYLGYLLWMLKLTSFIVLRSKKNTIYYAVDFECALPIYFASMFRSINYVYDIYDEFAIRYRFPIFLQKTIKHIDSNIRRKSLFFIHVDESRIDAKDRNYTIIPNIPFDYYNSNFPNNKVFPNNSSIAVTGYLAPTRGIESMYEFAKANPTISFEIYGEFKFAIHEKMFKELPNAKVYTLVPQNELFEKIKNCSAILALYDPLIEINRKAASNKLFDAMMLGVPIVTNHGILMSEFVLKNQIGIVVNYTYDDSWSQIIECLKPINAIKYGLIGRKLFENNYNLEKIVTDNFILKINELHTN